MRKGDKKVLLPSSGRQRAPGRLRRPGRRPPSPRERFVRDYDATHRLEAGGGKIVLYVGADDFPFPIPIVPDGASWRFDTPAGQEEILNRRIGRNELNAIQVCLAYVDAQREYYAAARKHGDGCSSTRSGSRARRASGTASTGRPRPASRRARSGRSCARARAEGYGAETRQGPVPFHGYYYRILTGQGPDAPAGRTDYVARGHMIGGFGLVAYPAQYGVSGVMTFIVNHDGVVYQKDLGANTAARAKQMKLFNPDTGLAEGHAELIARRGSAGFRIACCRFRHERQGEETIIQVWGMGPATSTPAERR